MKARQPRGKSAAEAPPGRRVSVYVKRAGRETVFTTVYQLVK